MNQLILGFCIVGLSSLLWPDVPTLWSLPLFILIAVLLWRKWPLISGGCIAVFWFCTHYYLLNLEPEKVIPAQQEYQAEIVSLVSDNRDWISIDVRLIDPLLTKINIDTVSENPLQARYHRLTWQNPPKVKVGQVWLFKTKLKPISSVLNQGGFNQQRYFINRHIVAKGRVKQAELISATTSLRSKWVEAFHHLAPSLEHGDLLAALLFGDKSLIKDKWQALRQTGTGHLIAISGLHLSVVFGFTLLLYHLLVRAFYHTNKLAPLLQNRLSMHLGLGTYQLGVVIALVIAVFYGYLAGFAVATQRALIMLIVWVVLGLFCHYHSVWQRVLYALGIVLVIDPFSILSAGFWLSFVAIAIILTIASNTQSSSLATSAASNAKAGRLSWLSKTWGAVATLWAIQWRLALGLGLLQIMLFGTISIHSIWVNLIVVPYFSLIVIPLALVCFCLWLLPTQLFSLALDIRDQLLCFWLADKALLPFSYLLDKSSDFPLGLITVPEALVCGFIFALISGLWFYKARLIFTKRWRNLYVAIGCILLIPVGLLIFDTYLRAAIHKPVQMHVLDVAQGSAVVFQRGEYATLYDTGAAFGDFSYAERVILPFLNAKGIRHVDNIIISHQDNDHIGGLKTLLKHYPEAQVTSQELTSSWQHYLQQQQISLTQCTDSTMPVTRKWQGIHFTYLPNTLVAFSKNNASCVVKVTMPNDAQTTLLLTGDIEASREHALLSRFDLRADILFVPHHGSRTSSTSEFINAVSPNVAIINAGYINQYGFPKRDVVTRLHSREIQTITSGEQGQISLDFTHSGYKVSSYRDQLAPFWYNRLFKFGEKDNPE